jgi:hypothetical protein
MRIEDQEEFAGVFAAAKSGNLMALRVYLEVDPLSCAEALEEGPLEGYTPFSLVIKNGNVEAAKLFIEYGFNLNLPLLSGTYEGFSPFMLAILFGQLELLKLFLEEGVEIAAPIAIGDYEGQTSLCVATQRAHIQPQRIDIVKFLLSTDIAFDAKCSNGAWVGKSVVDYARHVKDAPLVRLFESEEKRMNIFLNLVEALLSVRIFSEINWVSRQDAIGSRVSGSSCQNALHYLSIKSTAQNIEILNIYFSDCNLLSEIDNNDCTIYIKKTDLAKNISTLARSGEKWEMFYDRNSFVLALTPSLDKVIGQRQSWLEGEHFYITCNKRGAYILRDFLSELQAEMETEGLAGDPYKKIAHKNSFRIPCKNLAKQNQLYFDGLIYGIEANLRKLDRFRDIAKNGGKCVVNGKPKGFSVTFHQKKDEERLMGMLKCHFQDLSSLYSYEEILDIPDADFDKIFWESEKIKLQNESIDEDKVQEFQEAMKCLVPCISHWTHENVLLFGKDLKPKCIAVFNRLKEPLQLVLYSNEHQIKLNKLYLSILTSADIESLRACAQKDLDHLHAVASAIAKISIESKKDLFQENGLFFSCKNKSIASVFNQEFPLKRELLIFNKMDVQIVKNDEKKSDSFFLSYENIFTIKEDQLVELKQNIDKVVSPKSPSHLFPLEIKKPTRIRAPAVSFYTETQNNEIKKKEKVRQKAPAKKEGVSYITNLPKEERIPRALYLDLIQKTLSANPEQSTSTQRADLASNCDPQKMPSLSALIYNQIRLISQHSQESRKDSHLLLKKNENIKACVKSLANFCESPDADNELGLEIHQFMRACWGSSVLSFAGIWVLANWAEKIIQGESEMPRLSF